MEIYAGIAIVVVLAIAVAAIIKRYKVAGPSEAFIVTGRKGKPVTNPETGEVSTDLSGQKVVMGSGVFVLPFIQRIHTISLASRSIPVRINNAVSKDGIRLALESVAVVKVGGTEDAIRAAAQRFLHQQDQIEGFTQEVLAGSLRSIVGELTVEEIISNRKVFAAKVAEASETDLTNQGLVLDTFQIQDVTDSSDYIKNLGRPQEARVRQAADIAEAEAKRESESARLKSEEEIANAEREFALRKAAILQETDAADAKAAAAGPLAKASSEQQVLEEEEKVAAKRALVTERELDAKVRKPADAARYEAVQNAEAQAASERLRAAAEAEAIRLRAEAEAEAIRQKGLAEAEAMDKKAEALAKYGEAAVTQMVVETLPLVAKELAAPMANINDLRVISTDGATHLSKNVTENLAHTLGMVESATGVNLQALLAGIAGGAVAKQVTVETKDATPSVAEQLPRYNDDPEGVTPEDI